MSEEQWILPGLSQTAPKIDLPVPGEEFVPSGFIGQWMAMPLHKVYVPIDGTPIEREEGLKQIKALAGYVKHRETTNGAFVYFDTNESAKAATEDLDLEHKVVNFIWHWEAQKDRLLWYTEESKDKFKYDPISGDVDINSLRSRKYRHQFHLVALPSAVAAVARGYFGDDGAQFDINALLARDVQDDAFYEKMCGSPDQKKAMLTAFKEDIENQVAEGVAFDDALSSSRKMLQTPMEYGELYLQRKWLWGMLGEPDPTKYTFGQTRDDKPVDSNTESAKLGACLGIVQAWDAPRWARVVFCPDPRVDATYETDDGVRRNTFPVVLDFYKSEAEAVTAFESFRAGDAEEGGKPPLPASWVGIDEDKFIGALQENWGQPEAVLTSKMGCSMAEAQAWATHLDLQ